MPTKYIVRLKPYSKKRGYLCRNYSFRGVRFTDRWTVVSEATAAELSKLAQPHTEHMDEEDHVLLFDVMTEDEAKKVSEAEHAAATGKHVNKAPVVRDSDFRKVQKPVHQPVLEPPDDDADGEQSDDQPNEELARKFAEIDADEAAEHEVKKPVKKPVKSEPVKSEPVKTEPVKSEPVKSEPVKTEPAPSLRAPATRRDAQ